MNLNAASAVMHVLADLLRSFCVLIDGIIIKYLDHQYSQDEAGRVHVKEEEVQTDIICTIVLCFIIMISCVPVVRELAPRLRNYKPIQRLFRLSVVGEPLPEAHAGVVSCV